MAVTLALPSKGRLKEQATALFAKAGFTIEFENEDDSSTSHCEFTATHSITGKQFSVEAKAVTTASKRSGASAEPPRIRGYLAEALRMALRT